ncbi:MAG: hypothetical protein QF676_00860 [Dehalococcoidia bacterium]|jgi:hypothetical protein|nr:hypothetical protein [Dehalococcoidia bacterium]MDP7261147.1 hypothetical protein [Dehalococcoidia bacterium]
MCRTTTGPLLAMMGVAGTAAGVGLAVIRERIDRITDSRAAKQAANDQESVDASRSGDSNDSE